MSTTSTIGPKTPRGKATSAANAITHGILARVPVLPGLEDDEEWVQYRRGLFDALAPDGYFECALVERAACLFWRLRRVERYETEMATIARYRAEQQAAQDASEPTSYGGHEHLLPPPDVLDRVMRYEAHLHRQLTAVLHELEAAQTRRQGGVTPLARLDLSGFSPSHPGFRSHPNR